MWHTVFGKLQIVDPSEGRGVNFHTLAKKNKNKAGAWFTMLRPPVACMEGCVRVCVTACEPCSVFVGMITRVC